MPSYGFRTFTGESAQQLLLRSAPPSPALLSCTDPAQQFLESSVFRTLADIRERSAHPLHVKRIRLSEGHAPIVFLDGVLEDRAVAARFLEGVLPAADSDDLLTRNPGIRILAVQGRDLHLGLIGTDARLIFRGAPKTDWDAIRREYVSQVTVWGEPLCFRTTLTSIERVWAPLWPPRKRLIEMESRLLRRIGLFTEFNSAHLTYAYGGGPNSLKFWFEFDQAVERKHDLLVEALTDPHWGLGMDVVGGYCSCSLGQTCGVTLSTPDGQARIFMRFVPYEALLGPEYYESVGARKAWVTRCFPLQVRQDQ